MGWLRFEHVFCRSFVESGGIFQTVLIIFLLIPCSLTVNYTAAPLMPNETFLWAWNVPAENCIGNFNHSLDLSLFSFIGTPRKTSKGQAVTIFYRDQLGKYPYIDENKAEYFGGVPEGGLILQEHLDKAKTDIEHYIPVDQLGLAVIDWRAWDPIWERNVAPKDIHTNKSTQLIRSKFPFFGHSQAVNIAKQRFENAGRKLMEETLILGKRVRPKNLWGYYYFPPCYNYENYTKPGYSGKCNSGEISRNNDLRGIWKETTALYPVTTLVTALKLSPNAKLFSRYRVLESIRISKLLAEANPIPVYLYTRVVFEDRTSEFLSINDLENLIGEAIALGASGVVISDPITITQQGKTGCAMLHKYMKDTLSPYMINITLAVNMCSQTLCNHQGICTRKSENSNHSLQLNPMNLEIKPSNNGSFEVVGNPRVEDLKYFLEHFKCACYTKMNCKERLDIENVENVNVCTHNNICINAHVIRDVAFYLLPRKKLVFFIAVTHILCYLL